MQNTLWFLAVFNFLGFNYVYSIFCKFYKIPDPNLKVIKGEIYSLPFVACVASEDFASWVVASKDIVSEVDKSDQ